MNDLNIDVLKCGAYHFLALTQTGELFSWGYNLYEQCGIDSEQNIQLSPAKIDHFIGSKVVMTSCGFDHPMALTECGHVYSWCKNNLDESGFSNVLIVRKPMLIYLHNIGIIKISCNLYYSLLLTVSGIIHVFGYNNNFL